MQSVLGRPPDDGGLEHFARQIVNDALPLEELRRVFLNSLELSRKDQAVTQLALDSPFFHYNACFDVRETIRRHAVDNLQPASGYLTNFLGVAIDPRFFLSLSVILPPLNCSASSS